MSSAHDRTYPDRNAARTSEVAGHAANGKPDGEESYEEDGEEGEEDVGGLDADGVGIDDEAALAGTEFDEAEANLSPAQCQATYDAQQGSNAGDEPPFEEEDLTNLAVVGSEGAQGGDIFLLLNHQHGEGADDVEGGDEENEREEEVGNELLDLHNAEGVCLLLIAVLNEVALAEELTDGGFCVTEVCAWLQL